MNWPGAVSQSIQQLFRGPAQSFDIGAHLNLSLDNLYCSGRVFHGDNGNDGSEIATIRPLRRHSHKAAISHVQNIPRRRESNTASLRSLNRSQFRQVIAQEHPLDESRLFRCKSATGALHDFSFAERGAREALRTTRAAQLAGVRLPGAWGSGSGLRAEPVSGPPCALVGSPLLSRGSCARTAFHRPCEASSREKRPRAASSFLEL
jgi:hypothetical protein